MKKLNYLDEVKYIRNSIIRLQKRTMNGEKVEKEVVSLRKRVNALYEWNWKILVKAKKDKDIYRRRERTINSLSINVLALAAMYSIRVKRVQRLVDFI